MKYNCPADGTELEPKSKYNGLVHGCSHCGGEMLNITILKKDPELEETAHTIWKLSKPASDSAGFQCPECHRDMKRVYYEEAGITLRLCRHCQLIWFEEGQYDKLPRIDPEVAAQNAASVLSEKSIEALLKAERTIDEEIKETIDSPPPPKFNNLFEAVSNLPTINDDLDQSDIPWISWGLITIFTIVFLSALSHLGKNVMHFGYRPTDPFRMYGLTIFTSFFLQRNFLHLFAGVYFLKLFGERLEKKSGSLLVLLLLAVGHIAGILFLTLFNFGDKVTEIGIGAGLSALIAYYVVLTPTEKFSFILLSRFHKRTPTLKQRLFGRPAVYRIPAYWSLISWIVIQLFLQSIASIFLAKHTSLLPVVGGTLVGLMWGYVVRIRNSEEPLDEGRYHNITIK